MESTGETLTGDTQRLTKLEKQNRLLSLILAVNLGTLLILGVNACAKGSDAGVEKIETSHIYLRDPHGRIVGEIGSEPGFGNDKDLYRPFIHFWDRGEKPVMTLYGTGLNMVQGDQRASFNFLGMDVSNKKAEFIANGDVLSYSAHGGQMLVLPKKDGMNLTVQSFGEDGDETSVFGVLTGPEDSSMYVAAHKNEIDVTADAKGTKIVRGKSQ